MRGLLRPMPANRAQRIVRERRWDVCCRESFCNSRIADALIGARALVMPCETPAAVPHLVLPRSSFRSSMEEGEAARLGRGRPASPGWPRTVPAPTRRHRVLQLVNCQEVPHNPARSPRIHVRRKRRGLVRQGRGRAQGPPAPPARRSSHRSPSASASARWRSRARIISRGFGCGRLCAPRRRRPRRLHRGAGRRLSRRQQADTIAACIQRPMAECLSTALCLRPIAVSSAYIDNGTTPRTRTRIPMSSCPPTTRSSSRFGR